MTPVRRDDGDQMVDDEVETGSRLPAPGSGILPNLHPVVVSMLDGILPPDIADMIPSLGGLLADPIILAALGGVIVLLLILVLLKRRKAAQDDDSLYGGGR